MTASAGFGHGAVSRATGAAMADSEFSELWTSSCATNADTATHAWVAQILQLACD